MKKVSILFLVILLNTLGKSQNQNKDLLGLISKADLLKSPYFDWYKTNYDNYIVDEAKLKPFSDRIKKISIKVFLGTWCGDTKREVPKFLKITDSPWFTCKNLELIAVSNGKNIYKQSPQREEKGLAILRVATFIFFEDGKEIGRIVESPVVSFEQDLANILNGNRYRPNYYAGTTFLTLIDQNKESLLENNHAELADEWKAQIKNSGELNSLGYLLIDQNKLQEAINIFKLNVLLFPNVSNVYDSLAEAYEKSGDKDNAMKNFLKALELDPQAENAMKKVREMR
jgi:tetratricopeptide (TPR) repeat protein